MSAFLGLCVLILLAGHFMLVAQGFREHILWGLICLFVPFGSVIFGALHWAESKKALAVYGSGIALTILAGVAVGFKGSPKATNVATTTAKTESAAMIPASASPPSQITYTPPPPPPPVRVEPERSVPMIEQVYVDNATNLYYSEKCKRRPESTYRVAKSMAIQQGFTAAACP